MKNRAVFLDRDGTINIEKNYLVKYEDWEFIPKSVEAIKGFKELGFLVVVVSNQSGIARGYYSDVDVRNLHERVNTRLQKSGCMIDAFYICPHHPDFTACSCRKPAPGMLLKAAGELYIDLKSSYMIGDRLIDVQAGQNAGALAILVKTGYGNDELPLAVKAGADVADDLYSAYLHIKQKERG